MNLFKTLRNIRRTIHRNPELGNMEIQTSALVEKILKDNNIKTYRLCNTGVIGIIEGKKRTSKKIKTIALRADLDALPIKEKNNTVYKSKNEGIMHACGHDGNTTIMLGAAILLSQQIKKFSDRVQFIFQPNEEASGGAQRLIDAGVLKKNKVDCILGVHVSPWIKSGKIGLKYGAMMAGVDKFVIEIKGLLGHGAYPHLSKDAIVAASDFVMSIQTVVSRVINPVEPAVVTVGEIKGGERYNIICGSVKLTGTVRTFSLETREKIRKEIIKKLEGISKSYDVTYDIDYRFLGSPLINTKEIVDICADTANTTYGKNNVVLIENPSMAGEDFAEYLKKVKGCFIYAGTSSNKATSYPWHHEKFDLDEKALPKASQYIADIVKNMTDKSFNYKK